MAALMEGMTMMAIRVTKKGIAHTGWILASIHVLYLIAIRWAIAWEEPMVLIQTWTACQIFAAVPLYFVCKWMYYATEKTPEV